MFFQTVLLESPSVAGLHLVVPSISFTIVATITATVIARLNSTKPTLCLSQGLLAVGSAGLVIMVSTFPSLRMRSFFYNVVLTFPAAGASMMAPSTFLTLLNGVEKEEYAATTAGFTTARSLGVLVATTLGTTTLQNTLNFYFSDPKFDHERSLIEEARKNIGSILQLDANLQNQGKLRFNSSSMPSADPHVLLVRHAFAIGYTILFTVCFCATLAIILSISSLEITGILGRSNQPDSSSSYELVEAQSDDET